VRWIVGQPQHDVAGGGHRAADRQVDVDPHAAERPRGRLDLLVSADHGAQPELAVARYDRQLVAVARREPLQAQPQERARQIVSALRHRKGPLRAPALSLSDQRRLAAFPMEPGAIDVQVSRIEGAQIGAARKSRDHVPVRDEVLTDVDEPGDAAGARLEEDRPDDALRPTDRDPRLAREDAEESDLEQRLLAGREGGRARGADDRERRERGRHPCHRDLREEGRENRFASRPAATLIRHERVDTAPLEPLPTSRRR